MTDGVPLTGSDQNAYWAAAARDFLSLDSEVRRLLLERMTLVNRATMLASINQAVCGAGR